MVWAATAIAGTTAVYTISESERNKKKMKKVAKEEKKAARKERTIMSLQDQAERSKRRRAEAQADIAGSGATASNLTGRSDTLG